MMISKKKYIPPVFEVISVENENLLQHSYETTGSAEDIHQNGDNTDESKGDIFDNWGLSGFEEEGDNENW